MVITQAVVSQTLSLIAPTQRFHKSKESLTTAATPEEAATRGIVTLGVIIMYYVCSFK